MWLLLVICVSTAAAVPINSTHDATPAPPGNVTAELDVPQPATVEAGGVALNDTQNVTAAAGRNTSNVTQNVTSAAAGKGTKVQKSSPETQEELEDKMDIQEGEEIDIQEGDILLPAAPLEDRNAVQTLWANGILYYTISPDLADQVQDILMAFKMISDYTCIRFQRRATELNYLKLLKGKGCASFVGCRGGAQPVYISRTCSMGNLCHEIIHALGLHHEHTRKDRDQYITVQWQNIIPGMQKNFKVKSGNTQNLPYDLDSIMHYGENFFSVDGSPTVISKHPGAHLGQRSHLSMLDIQRLNKLYRCGQRM